MLLQPLLLEVSEFALQLFWLPLKGSLDRQVGDMAHKYVSCKLRMKKLGLMRLTVDLGHRKFSMVLVCWHIAVPGYFLKTKLELFFASCFNRFLANFVLDVFSDPT